MNSINHLLDIWQVEEEKPPKESTQMIQEKIWMYLFAFNFFHRGDYQGAVDSDIWRKNEHC